MNYNKEDYSFHKFPPVDEYKERLNALKTFDFSLKTQGEIHRIFFEHSVMLPLFVSPLSAEEFGQRDLYRVRLNVNPSLENILLNTTFSYPPPNFCRVNGRANLKGKSVFYCSDSGLTAIYESKPKPGDTVVLSIWKVKADREVKAALFLPENIKNENHWSAEAKDLHNYLKNQIRFLNSEKDEQINLLNAFVCDRFVEESNPYALTSWLSDYALYRDFEIDLIVYPSFITGSVFCNLAIHPNFIDRFVRLEKLFQFKIESISIQTIDYALGLVGTPGPTNIIWKEVSLTDAEYFEKKLRAPYL